MMAVDTPKNESVGDDGQLLTPRFDLSPYARSMSTGELRAAVALEDDETRECAVRMFQRFNADDHLFALDDAEALLAHNPRHALANACATECRARIERDYAALVRPNAIPSVVASPERIAAAQLDHREGFLLSLIDGCITVEVLSDVSGMEAFALLRGLAKLSRLNIIAIANA